MHRQASCNISTISLTLHLAFFSFKAAKASKCLHGIKVYDSGELDDYEFKQSYLSFCKKTVFELSLF